MPTPEFKVKQKVKKLLAQYECYYFMPVQTGLGAPGLDFHCVAPGGKAFFVEAKAGNKQPTARQQVTIKAIQKCRAPCFVVNEVTGMDTLEMWLKEIT